MRGELSADHASIAALGHAVHAAGAELALRAGTAPVRSVTLHGREKSLSLLSLSQGVLMLEHEKDLSEEALLTLASSVVSQPPPVVPPSPVLQPSSFSLADALHATAP